jgi:spore maturation protein CgeB
VEAAMKIVICGLTITSSWGNGHATTYRGLVRAFVERGHEVSFLERDAPWYAENRDLPEPPYGRTTLYGTFAELKERHVEELRDADLVIIGSYVPEGVQVAEWIFSVARGVVAFYDIDTPVTLSMLERGSEEYLSRRLVPRFELYLSFTGGPTLERLQREYGAQRPRPLYCAVDPSLHREVEARKIWDLGYLGTYSKDRQPKLESLLLEPARSWRRGRFIVAGPQYPESIGWPRNISRRDHVPPPEHAAFYASQRFTLNITRADMARAGYSPSVRLFEAAACGTPIISDDWPGLEELFTSGREILIAKRAAHVRQYLQDISEDERIELGRRAQETVLSRHTAAHRATQVENYFAEVTASHDRGPTENDRTARAVVS